MIALIKEAGRQAFALPGDLRDETFCKKLVADAVKQLGGLDILVCNAARQQTRASILDVSTEDFDATMKTNIYAPFWIIKAALSHMPPGSVIIGTTSEQATDPSPEIYDYADQSGHDQLCTIACETTSAERHSRERRRAGTDLDAIAGQRRRDHGKIETFWRKNPARPPGPTGRARINLCSARR